MKIRIRGNSIRYRLTKSEVEAFCKTGYFAQKTEFNTTLFCYEIKIKKNINSLQTDFANNTITIYVPNSYTKDWATNSVVGFNNNYITPQGKTLFILVEKDFVCMDETVEDQSDNYPNPNA
ncbi:MULTISPECIES: DUF7009 family protein [Cellulophaga]|uniref:Uncharacterized protein n=2 Tax=Cellulophaga TaxID=104264 RepID=F0RBW0_CELLC|nr:MULTISPECIES: hypothetical protein [Cellulophaga]ADY28576.1 hypothetical protein Celly_0744 [Cellulophaga lytica DSM 7489]APU09488.1 hypothetical protein A5M85_04075 [Cellulophaga lytica]EWH12935.1 hypothetical protein KLA_12307 [Cellulophaga geojensis KL-A]MDO6853879.1 hypothetical protein [Cellulophaga lytica]TVZ08857.1 hypothetical protein JM80_1360 [Cellulophaga sp. RHA_52]